MYTEMLSTVTFSLHHNPNCSSPFQIRLVGPNTALLDNLHPSKSRDIIGHGPTMEKAAQNAWLKKFPN